jgi:hypothetical protein
MAKKRPTRAASRANPHTTPRGPGRAAPDTSTSRKEQARLEREALLRKREAGRRNRRLLIIGGPLLVVVVVILGIVTLKKTPSSKDPAVYATVGQTVDANTLPGIQTGAAPWPPELSDLRARLQAIGFPALGEEGTVLHIHQHLDLFIDGAKVTVPADIGIGSDFLSAIHTHDISGVIHVESPTRRAFTLGEFFDVWGVRFTSTCLGGYCDGGGKTLRVYVDGHLATGNIRQIQLLSHEEIAAVYGSPSDNPSPIPSTYSFPFGY